MNLNKRKVFGIIIILIGICIVMYPIVKTTYANYVQKQLMHEIKQAIKDNMEGEKQASPDEHENSEDTEDTEDTEVTHTITIDNHYDELGLVEEEQLEEESAEKTRERLKNQEVIGIIEIEKIKLIYAVVEGTSDDNLGVAIGHMLNTAGLGQTGNCALAGHRGGTSGPYFKNIDKLSVGDEIKLTNTNGNEYLYHVTESFIVEPTDVWVAENNATEALLTLITCTDNGSKRLIVRAKMD